MFLMKLLDHYLDQVKDVAGEVERRYREAEGVGPFLRDG
jgi:hypothetical protein